MSPLPAINSAISSAIGTSLVNASVTGLTINMPSSHVTQLTVTPTGAGMQFALTPSYWPIATNNTWTNWPDDDYNSFVNCQLTNDGLILDRVDGKYQLPVNKKYKLPVGTVIEIDAQGNFHIDDTDAKVIYKANRIHEFNRFVNASDLLAKFIEYVRSLKVDRSEVATLPLALFVNWLVIEAAEADDEEVPSGVVAVPQHRLLLARTKPRCDYCKRFIPRKLFEKNFTFCNPAHAAARYKLLSA